MAHVDQPGAPGSQSPGALQFPCPACQRELSIPAHLAGVEGPCPHCQTPIAAPIPARGQGARRLSDPVPQARPAPAPPTTPTPTAPPPTPDSQPAPAPRQVQCAACGSSLVIEPSMAHLPGGPCPRCQTWIDLQGHQAPASQAQPPVAAPHHSPEPAPTPSTPSESFGQPDGSGSTELNRSPSLPAEEPPSFPKIPDAPEATEPAEASDSPATEGTVRRRVRRRKKKRQLPPEFYVGHAAGELDARGQESADRARRDRFPDKGGQGSRKDSKWAVWLPVALGILLPLLGGLYAAIHFKIIDPADLKFWDQPRSSADPEAQAVSNGVTQTEVRLKGKAKQAYQTIEAVVTQFLEAESWEDAERHLYTDNLPENSEALSFLKMFPREEYHGAQIKVVDFIRIPKTERFTFALHLDNGMSDLGEPRIGFMIGEQMETGLPQLHALQLYQSWKSTLTDFLETSGSAPSRFYARLRLADSSAVPDALTFPDDGPYVKLILEDWLVKRPWMKEVYVRKASWAGTRLLNGLTTTWSRAVIDLEWLQGPTGDAFVHVAGVYSSNWGDFPKQ